jgi:hypothetical protein
MVFVSVRAKLRGRVPVHPAPPLTGEEMSWHASGHVKNLTHHKDGTRLSAREKLILFVLADSHNEDRGNCAWIGIEKAAKNSLTSRSRFIELLRRLEDKGTIRVQRREGQSNLYFFPDLPVRESDPPTKQPVQKSDPTRPIATGPHPSDSCRTQAFSEPSVTDIQPGRPTIPMEVLNQRLDDYYKKRYQTDDEGRKYLISPSSGERIYA